LYSATLQSIADIIRRTRPPVKQTRFPGHAEIPPAARIELEQAINPAVPAARI
jgi:hypothetical protein